MRISALISDVCSSDLIYQVVTRKLNRSAIIEIGKDGVARTAATVDPESRPASEMLTPDVVKRLASGEDVVVAAKPNQIEAVTLLYPNAKIYLRSEEHTSELQSLMRISYAVFCLKKKTQKKTNKDTNSFDNRTLTTTTKLHRHSSR